MASLNDISRHQKAMLKLLRLMAFIVVPFFAKCQNGAVQSMDYNLEEPIKLELAKELKEISGIVVCDTGIYAITDDKGKLYHLNKSGKIIAEWNFAKDDDYEEIALVNNTFFVLNSNGDIYAFERPSGSRSIDAKKFTFPFGKNNEFEILYYDNSRSKLVMICKECNNDDKKSLTAYTIEPQTGIYAVADFNVDATRVAEIADTEVERLKPSAAAIHPLTDEVFIVSSINKLLIRMDRNGKVKTLHSLNRSDFEQPEGISFSANGDMLISNEAGNNKRATILLFKYLK